MLRSMLTTLNACWFIANFAFAQTSLEQARPWLGVLIDPGQVGVLVKEVIPGTPAAEYGLKAGDEIIAVAAAVVKTPYELMQAVQNQGVGSTVALKYLRSGQPMEANVKLVARPDQVQLLNAALLGKAAPAFDLPVIHGSAPGNSEALKGRVVLVEFWATWCPACRDTHQRLSEFAQKYPEVAVIGVSDEDEGILKKYAKDNNILFTILRDSGGKASLKWMVAAVPTLVVLNKNGEVVFVTIGTGSYLEAAIAAAEKLLQEQKI